jgi:hypothetical protein
MGVLATIAVYDDLNRFTAVLLAHKIAMDVACTLYTAAMLLSAQYGQRELLQQW